MRVEDSFENDRAARIRSLDTSEAEHIYLLDFPGGAKIRLPEVAKVVLQARWSGAQFGAIAEELERRDLRRATAEEVERYFDALTAKIDRYERSAQTEAEPMSFGVKVTLFSAERAARIADRLTWLYERAIAFPLAAVVLAALVAWAMRAHGRHTTLDAGGIVLGYALFFASLIAHEFGHASACRRYGGESGRIGFTVYLVFPALFSDVSAAWGFTRAQRVVVDLAGTYVQGIVGAACVAVWFLTGWEAFSVATMLMVLTGVFNLNPIFKFDGYWVLADALGVTNLAQQPQRLFEHYWGRLRGRTVRALPWPTWIVAAMGGYTVLTVVVWTYFVARTIASVYPRFVAFATLSAGVYRHRGIESAGELRQLLFGTLGLALTIYFLVRIGKLGVTHVRVPWRARTPDRGPREDPR
ncbi:MAG: hypothetical protein M3N49_12425 [Candidatus Eremiobacteraeota bacterium]|nr:hypothetical protein [Candidatus Eremiobacteraeota bacterium]